MTSAPSKVGKRMRIKEKQNIGILSKSTSDDAARAFLNFPLENLSVSQSDIEQGFNKSEKRLRINRSTILNSIAICLSLVCITLETIKFQKVLDNSRDIEAMRRDLDTLRNRLYEEDLLDELKAFEQQLYADEGGTEDSDIDDDYDLNYENYGNDESDYLVNNNVTTKVTDESTAKSKNIETKHKRFVPTEYNTGQLSDISEAFDKKSALKNELKSKGSRLKKNKQKHSKSLDVIKPKSMKSGNVMRNLRAPRNVFAAHYEADMTLFENTDEHTGNGRAKHNEGVFKAWRPSDWMGNFGMNRYFILFRDGRLIVHESGIYLVYAQIHYLDEHDENGFHILINGQPILQCMVYSPGIGHKSRSCYSSQVTYIKSGDHIVVKDVGPARFTLFQRDKSFFGLIKLGDTKQSQLTWHSTSPQPESTEPPI